jgi:hypothetical protein
MLAIGLVRLSNDGSKIAVGAFIDSSVGFNSGHTRVFGNPTLSVEDVVSQNFTMYPNPARINVFVQSKTVIETITIFDGSGAIVKTITPTNTQGNYPIDVSDLATGFYFMTLETDTASVTKKFIKN